MLLDILWQSSSKLVKRQKTNEELQSLLQSMKSLDQSSYISSRTRGGLVNPSKDLVGILEQAEYEFRQQVIKKKSTLRNIPIDEICNGTLKKPNGQVTLGEHCFILNSRSI